MWRAQGTSYQYVYWPGKSERCGDHYMYEVGSDPFIFEPGIWYRIEHHIRMNTPGFGDGLLEASVDGQVVLYVDDFLYRVSGQTYGIDGLYFSTFFGEVHRPGLQPRTKRLTSTSSPSVPGLRINPETGPEDAIPCVALPC